jgi:uncharacterized delta-60 repeat protein
MSAFVRSVRLATFAVCTVALAACTSPEPGGPAPADARAGDPDSGMLAQPDAMMRDAGLDAAPPAMLDAGPPDAGPLGPLPDPGFGEGGVVALNGGVTDAWRASACSVGGDGAIVVAGTNGSGRALFVRLREDGALDAAFGDRGAVERAYGSGQAVALEVRSMGDGRVVARTSTDDADHRIVRLTSSGAADTSFDGDGVVVPQIFGVVIEPRALAVAADGRVTVAGRVWESATRTDRHDFLVARFAADGRADASFDADGYVQLSHSAASDEEVRSLAVDAYGRPVLGGTSGGDAHTTLARLGTAGYVDTAFGTGGVVLPSMQVGSVATIALRSHVVHVSETHATRVDETGAPDVRFGSGGTAALGCRVRAIAARAESELWWSCEGASELRGIDAGDASALRGGAPISVPPVALASGLGSIVEIGDVCTGGGGEIVAVGSVRESGSSAQRGIFVARFVD